MIDQYIIFIIGGFILIIILVIYLSIRAEKNRTKALSSAALQLGFTMSDYQKHYQVPQLSLFHIGHSHKSSNVMRGRYSSINWAVFDYRYTKGAGKSHATFRQTVAHAQLGTEMPAFNMSREHLGHKLIGLIGYNDIDFDSHPVFSKKYYLKSKDEKIRKLFRPRVLEFFEHRDHMYNIEASGKDMIIYRKGRTVKPKDMRAFLEEAAAVVRLFEDSAKNMA